MAYKITEDCIACGNCESECLNHAITEGENQYVIAPEKCTECVGFRETARCAEICPLGIPTLDPENHENHEQLLTKWKKLHPGEIPACPN